MYGPVYKANDTTSNDYVTIHIVETIAPDKMKEIEVLNSIRSKFIIQYIDFDTHYDRVRVHVVSLRLCCSS